MADARACCLATVPCPCRCCCAPAGRAGCSCRVSQAAAACGSCQARLPASLQQACLGKSSPLSACWQMMPGLVPQVDPTSLSQLAPQAPTLPRWSHLSRIRRRPRLALLSLVVTMIITETSGRWVSMVSSAQATSSMLSSSSSSRSGGSSSSGSSPRWAGKGRPAQIARASSCSPSRLRGQRRDKCRTQIISRSCRAGRAECSAHVSAAAEGAALRGPTNATRTEPGHVQFAQAALAVSCQDSVKAVQGANMLHPAFQQACGG